MLARNHKLPDRKGNVEIDVSRYVVLYVAQLGWIVLGVYLFSNAYWPSTCRPADLLEIYSCSAHLPDNRGWVESALMTWLWSTPILVALEILRLFNKPAERSVLPER